MARILFLDLNGLIHAPPAEAISAVTTLADGTMSEVAFAAWIQRWV